MARKEFPQAVRDIRYANGAAVVKLAGEIDMSHSPGVHQTLVEVLENRPSRLIIDLTEVTYMDSSGVGILVDALRRVPRQRGQTGPGLCCPARAQRPADHQARPVLRNVPDAARGLG